MKIFRNLYYVSLMLVFFNFSMLLNCMGVVILQLSHERQSYEGLGFLEFFKDIPIAIISIFFTFYIAKFNNILAIKISLLVTLICCIALPFLNFFWIYKIWFTLIGISFAISKIAVFSSLKNNTKDDIEFAKSMNAIESMFMLGIFLINISFSYLLSTEYKHLWKFGFWGIAIIVLINILLLMSSKNRNNDTENNNFSTPKKENNSKKLSLNITLLFYVLIFSVVFLEQSLNSWLPSFYREHFTSSNSIALQSTAILALFSFLGRIFTSKKLQNYTWKKYILTFLFASFVIILVTNIFFNFYFSNSSVIIYLFPLIGFFVAPLYPVFNSKFLSKQNEDSVKINVAYINLFSSLGGSTGSFVMATLFQNQQSSHFLLFLLLILLLIIALGFIFIEKINNLGKIS